MERDQVCNKVDDFKSVPSEPLPNALDALSSDETSPRRLAANSSSKRRPETEDTSSPLETMSARRGKSLFVPVKYCLSRGIVTPIKSNTKEEKSRMITKLKEEDNDGEGESPEFVAPEPVISNAEVKRENNEVDGTDQHQNRLSDDFDLFDGALLRASEDEVLKNL